MSKFAFDFKKLCLSFGKSINLNQTKVNSGRITMAKKHNVRFLRLVQEAKSRITEISAEDTYARLISGGPLNIIDVREHLEFLKSHVERSRHLSKGIIERDVETLFPNPDVELILYCGGGFRSAIAADNLQRMGYTRVKSMAGGFRAWKALGAPITSV